MAPPTAAPLCVLSVHAHPDDEASKGAATMARYHDEGVRTVLVTCTGGEAGDILNPAADTEDVRQDLPAVRRRELDDAVRLIGYDELYLLGYRDSGMPDTEANAHPENFANADLDDATGRLVEIIRRERPQVIVGYARDRVYAHPDHVRVHEVSVLAFERAGDPEWYPELGEPWQPLKLYYSNGFTRQRIRALHDWFVAQGDESPLAKWVEHMDERDAAAASHSEAGDGHDDSLEQVTTTARRRARPDLGRSRRAARAPHADPGRQLLLPRAARGGTRAASLGGVRARTLPGRPRRARGRVRDRPVRRAQSGGELLSAPMPPDDAERSELDEALFSGAQPDAVPDPGPRTPVPEQDLPELDAALFGASDGVDEPTTSLAAPSETPPDLVFEPEPEILPALAPLPGPTAEADSTAVFATVVAPEPESDSSLSRRDRRRGRGTSADGSRSLPWWWSWSPGSAGWPTPRWGRAATAPRSSRRSRCRAPT